MRCAACGHVSPSESGHCPACGLALPSWGPPLAPAAVAPSLGDGDKRRGRGPGEEPPKPLDHLGRKALVGRQREMKELLVGFEDALAGRPGLFLLTGEPGIGKTRCAEELGEFARMRGARVLLGRCYNGEGTPAFWPWVQILRRYLREGDAAALRAELGSGAAQIAQMVPEVREAIGDLPTPLVLEPAEARFRLFDGVSQFLRRAANPQGLVIILDDLHYADKPSLVLLQFVAREIAQARVLFLCTYRDYEIGRQHPLFHTLGELAREPMCRRLVLTGLSEGDVARFIELITGQSPPAALVSTVSSVTDGNPFFVGEVVRLLAAEGRLEQPIASASTRMKLPQGVREAVGRRLDHLSAECHPILTLASVIGRDFRLETLACVSGISHERLLDVLEEAIAAHLVTEVPQALGRYRFSHELVRETLYEELPTTQRQALHSRIGEALEDLSGAKLQTHVAELAYHFFEAARAGGDVVDRAITYARRAGECATTLLAYEEAAGHYERALLAFEEKDPGDSKQRWELLLALGEAQNSAGDRDRARETFFRAAAVARRFGDADRFAIAALGLGPGFLGFEFGVIDHALVGLLEEGLRGLRDRDSALRSRVLGSLAMALYWSQARDRSRGLSEEAVEVARGLGDPGTLAAALHSRNWALWGTEDAAQRLASATEIVRLAAEVGDTAMALTGRAWRLASLLELGQVAGVKLEIEEVERLEEKLRHPRFRWLSMQWRAMLALLAGRFADAENLTQRVLSMAPSAQDRAAAHSIEQAFGVQMLILFREQGRLQELPPNLEGFVERYPMIPGWRCALAWVYSQLGREAEAREQFERVMSGLPDIPRDLNWIVSMSLLADTCAFLRDVARAATLYDLLLPYADRCIVVSFAVACFGSVARYLGILAASMSRCEEASRHFAHAIEVDGKLGALPWVANAQLEYARMLLVRGQPGDHEQALELIARAIDTGRELGAKALTERALALRLRADDVIAADARTSVQAVAQLIGTSPPDLRAHTGSDGTVTILFTDVEGFAAMAERLGEARAQAVLRAHNAIVREHVVAFEGVEVGCQRDGFMLAFADAQQALACAVAIQRAVSSYNDRHPIEPLRLRIGVHTGKAIDQVGRFLGDTVMAAARIASHARGGEILVSSPLHERAGRLGGLDFSERRPLDLRGTPSMRWIYRLGWAPECSVGEAVAAPPDAENVFRREGAYWTLAYAGTVCRLRDAKGLHHIAQLLRHPGREFTAQDLIAVMQPIGEGLQRADAEAGGSDLRLGGLGDAGPMLDAKAKAAYQRRLCDLREELAETERLNDIGRTAMVRAEIDMLKAQLAAAVGLGGRDRRAASSAERARLAVTKRIKDALDKIREEHPSLGQHLRAAIKTGYCCAYTPDPARPVGWSL